MHLKKALFCSAFICLFLLTACGSEAAYIDGNYRAEFDNFDSRGYKDFLEVTVENGAVISLHYNAVSEDGLLKNDDIEYRENMQNEQAIYPERFSQDLINQYLDTQSIDGVDIVAGATYSSECFLDLFNALEPQIQRGETDTLIVENTAEQ